jgi:chromate transporter
VKIARLEEAVSTDRGAVPRRDLFFGFLKIGLLGFGGVSAWAYRVIVIERQWLNDAKYAALLGTSQVLPGANTVNAAVILGDRFQGPSGAVVAVLGLMIMPLAIVVAIGTVFEQLRAVPDFRAAIDGMAMAAAGIVIGMALRMARRVRLDWPAVLFGLAIFLAVGIFEMPFVGAVLLIGALSIAVAYLRKGLR